MIFSLNKQQVNLLHCDIKDNYYNSGNDGLLCGNTSLQLPEEWTMLYSFYIYENSGANALIFEFGSWQEKNGFGLYCNQQQNIAFRINDCYDNYNEISTKIEKYKFYDIVIVKKEDKISLYINNVLKYETNEKINKFNCFGAFNRFATNGNKNEWTAGLLSNVVIYKRVLNESTIQDIFKSLKFQEDFKCPNCNENNSTPFYVNFNSHPKQGELITNEKIKYNICNNCDTIFSSEMMNWTSKQFVEKCYNDTYCLHDTDYNSFNSFRLQRMHSFLINYLYKQNFNKDIKYLDYGSGNGFLTEKLKRDGYVNGFNYDPYSNNNLSVLNNKYDLIICQQVIEHANNVNEIFIHFNKLLNDDGKIVITTVFHNYENFNNWWYCAPRVGHILFFTKSGFEKMCSKYNFIIDSCAEDKIIISKNTQL